MRSIQGCKSEASGGARRFVPRPTGNKKDMERNMEFTMINLIKERLE
jgi:hypothetical protein